MRQIVVPPLLLVLGLPLAAIAQDATPTTPVELPATVVVAKREPGVKADTARVGTLGEAPLLDTPASVSVFTRELLEAQRATVLTQVVLNDPSVAESYAPAGYYDSISIRGFELDVWNSYRINGMRISHDAAVPLENKERIEVLKGLGAVESGFSRPGGVVNYVTRRPTPTLEMSVAIDFDRFHGSRQHVDIGGPIDAAGRIGYRVNAAYETLRSYATGADGDRQFGSIALDWKIAPGIKLEFDAEYQERKQITVPGFQLLDGTTVPTGVDPRNLMNAQPWTTPFFTRTATVQGKLDVDLAHGWTGSLQAHSMRRKADDFVAFPYGFYGNYDFDVYDYRSVNETRSPRTIEALLRGSLATGSVIHRIAIGASHYRNTISNPDQAFNFVGVSNYFTPVILAPAPEPLYPVVSYRQGESAIYGEDTMEFGPSWRLLLGGRQTQVERQASGALEFEWQKDVFTPHGALIWKPRAEMSTYLSYGEGLEQGDPAPLGTTNQNQILDPLQSRQWEAGFKWDVMPALNLQTALFRIEKPLEYIDASNTWIQQGRQVHTGIEFNVAGRITPALSVFGGVTLLDSDQQSTGDPARDGKRKANVARERASLFVQYLAPIAGLTLDGRWQYVGRRAAVDDESVFVDGYHVFGLGARYAMQWARVPVTLGLRVDNLFDKNYWKDVGGGYLHLGAPRSWIASLQAQWR